MHFSSMSATEGERAGEHVRDAFALEPRERILQNFKLGAHGAQSWPCDLTGSLSSGTNATLPKIAKTRQTGAPFNRATIGGPLAHLTHVTHSQMLETRRRRKRAMKDTAGMARRAKKLKKWNAKKARAGAPKSP